MKLKWRPVLTGAESGLRIHLCGVRGSTPAPGIDFVRYGGQTSCVALAHDTDDAPRLVLDAGGGLQAVSRLLGDVPFTGTILLSHLHWDHTFGLPFFAAADLPGSCVAVVLPEQENGADAVSVLAGIMSPPYFPIGPTDLRGKWTFASIAPGVHQIEGFEVLAREIPHKGGRTFGYRISDGRAAFTYMPDHCPTALGAGQDGFGEYHPAAIELVRDVDLLVHDSQLFPEELAAEADFGHAVAEYAIELSKLVGARSVVLFHHRHDRTDEALDGLALRLASDGSPKVSVAAEGLVFEL
ncbi:MAG TPA: MBL fold metallo-hydrolase [Solirubrobacteraceae bacterium]|jgi:phosphoribosyl 1,2-cyclic phosphodiesterase